MDYSLVNHKTAEIEHLGSNILQDDRCSVEFSKMEFSHEQYICVSGQKIELDCGTKLEYHASFIKNYSDPEVGFIVVVLLYRHLYRHIILYRGYLFVSV